MYCDGLTAPTNLCNDRANPDNTELYDYYYDQIHSELIVKQPSNNELYLQPNVLKGLRKKKLNFIKKQ